MRIKSRLCLLCRKYISHKSWKAHLLKCEQIFRRSKGLGNQEVELAYEKGAADEDIKRTRIEWKEAAKLDKEGE